MKIHIENIHGLFDYAVEQNNGTVKKISYQTRIQCKNNQNLTDDTISKIENVKVVSSFVKYETPKEEFHIEETAEGQPRWVCLLCKVNFSLRSNLEIHVKKYHVSDEDESGTLKILRRGYCCDVCGCGLHNIDYLAAHRFSLHPEAKHLQWHKLKSCVDTVKLCLICMKYFRYGESFKRHFCVNEVNYKAVEKVRKALNVEPSFMCDICSQCFKWKFSYQYHREIEHKGVSSLNWEIIEPEKIEYYCKTCLKGFHEAYVLREHDCSSAKYEPKSMQKFQCEICEKLFGSKFSLRRHKRMTHERKITPPIFDVNRSTKPKGPTIKCPFCDIMFTSGKVVLSHVKDVHHQVLETPYFCVPCSKPFSIHSTLQIHNHLYHGTKEEPEELQRICKEAEITHKGTMAYECKTCYRIFDDSYKYIIHYRWHRADRKFTCERCGKRKTTRTQLNEHIRKEHENKSKKFDCDICGKTLSTKCALQGHLAVHKGEKSYTCEICGLTFVSMNRLLNHKAVHNEYVRLYHCNICLKGFKKRVLLKDHMHQHTGEKNVPCPVCGKKFATKTHVYYHKKRVHANVRPFECALCGLSFVIKSNLKRHVNLHMINPGMIVRRRNLSNKKHAVNCKSENV